MKDARQLGGQAPLTFELASTLVIEVLGALLRAAPDDLETAIDTVLARVGQGAGADRACVMLKTGDCWSVAHEWCAPGVAPRQDLNRPLSVYNILGWPEGHKTTEPFHVPSVAALPDGALQRYFQTLGVQSQIAVHFPPQASVSGYIGLERTTTPHDFAPSVPWLLQALTDGLSATLARRQAETRLEAAQTEQAKTLARLRATLSAMPELILEIDGDGRCVDFHCTAPDLLAGPPEEILGKTLEETLPPDIAHLQRCGMEEARKHGKSQVGPYALGEDDQKTWYSLTIVPQAHLGTQGGFVFRIQDVTHQHVRDAENAMLVEMARRMTNMAMVLEPDLRIRWVNTAFETRMGLTLAEVHGRVPAEFTDPTADPVAIAKINRALTSRTPVRAEIDKHDHNGTPYSVAIDIQPMHATDGEFQGFVVIETDITLQKRQQADLKQLASEAEYVRQRLQAAIDVIPDAFAIFDAEDRLVTMNREYRNALSGAATKIEVGMTFEEILDLGIASGDFPQALENGNTWKAQRLAAHALAEGEMELRLSNGRWMRAYERATPDGGRVGLRVDISALKHAEQRLSEIIDGARIGTWEYNVATNSAELNEHWATMLGIDPKDLTRIDEDRFPRIIDPADYALIQEQMREVLSGQKNLLEQEIKLRHHDGHWVHVLMRGQIIDGDKPYEQRRISGIGLDLTERRHAENRLQTILQASSIGTWQLNNESGAVIIDEQYAAMLGYTLDELTPWTKERFESFLNPMDLPEVHAGLAALYWSDKSTIGHEFRMRHRDGHWIWVLSRARVSRWAQSGATIEESGVHIDITESKNREAALADAKKALEQALAAQKATDQRFADIAAASDEWFWEVDETERIVFMSSGFERISSIPVASMLGKTLAEVGFKAGTGRMTGDWRALRRIMAKREKLDELLFQLSPYRDRPALWLRISGAPIFRDDGRFVGYRGVGSNVSEFIATTERAEAANLAKSRFLATMSHELRTPLTGVLGMADLLSETPVTDGQREMIDTIRDSGEGLLAIVNDILDLAKIEAGKMTVDHLTFTPADLFRRVHALFAPRAHTAGLVLGLELTPPCSERRLGDAHRIQQILNNLVGNAIKFTARGSVMMFGAIENNAHTDALVIRIVDTGIGMTKEQSAKVFEEFEQAEGSTARRFGGTGLGLSITRHLVTLMGGTITLDTALNHGTQVVVRVPLAPAPTSESERRLGTPANLDCLAGMRVLVADDNQANRRILQNFLDKMQIEVTLAEDGHQALSLYNPGAYDMLLLDISMPGLDGIGALNAIRTKEAAAGLPAVPALAVTANAMQHQIDEYLAAGFAGHVAKPFRKTDLLATIAIHQRTKA